MAYTITIKTKIERSLHKLPAEVKKLFFLLVEDLKMDGPIQRQWHNFSTIGKDKYHCHLNYRYVVCWTYYKRSIEIEVNYVGNREKAPY
jgi:mRNA-degrading endonuclease RelE of RelBE toxin-antitoxin system